MNVLFSNFLMFKKKKINIDLLINGWVIQGLGL